MGDYCTTTEVAAFLQVPAFSDSPATTPSLSQVEAFIDRAEAEIDNVTGHAWRTVTVTNEYHNAPTNRRNTVGGRWMAIPLNHRKIKTLDSGEGDKVEVWDGNAYVDYVSDANYSEGRTNDYWVDYTNGTLYITPWNFSDGEKAIRITYRYGDATVPADIAEAAIMLTANQIIQSDDRSVLLPEGTNNIPLTDKSSQWRTKARQIMRDRAELKIVIP